MDIFISDDKGTAFQGDFQRKYSLKMTFPNENKKNNPIIQQLTSLFDSHT